MLKNGPKPEGFARKPLHPQPRSSEARERLIRAASALMCELDTISISVRDVAARAGLNSSLISYYFGNKDRLLLEVVEHDTAPFLLQMQDNVDRSLSATKRMEHLITIIIEAMYRFPYVNHLLMAILHEFSPAQSVSISEQIVRPIYESIRNIIASGVAQREFREVDPVFMNFIIQGACAQIFSAGAAKYQVFNFDMADSETRRRFTAEVTTLILNGLMPAPNRK